MKSNLKFYISIFIFIVILLIRNTFFLDNKNFIIKNKKIINAEFVNYGWHLNSSKGFVKYFYKGKKYITKNFYHSVYPCFQPGDKLLIQIDSINPVNYAYLPDTFINLNQINERMVYDTFKAVFINRDCENDIIKFKIYENDVELIFFKLSKLKPKKDENLIYIVVNNNLNQGYLKIGKVP